MEFRVKRYVCAIAKAGSPPPRSILLDLCRADALAARELEHSARRVPSGCASGARRGAFCSVSAEQNAYAERAITKQNGSKCNPHGERRAERFRAGVKIQSAWQVPSRTRTRCACGARPGAFCSASAERMRFWSASWSILLGECRADAVFS